MSKLLINANYGIGNAHYNIILTLLEFEEDNNTIIYSPALDISGYGNNHEEAKKSFGIALEEFVNYTNNKKTLESYLEKMGWSILGSKKKPKFEPPKNSDLVSKNPFYSEIIDSKQFKSYNEKLELAI